MTFDHIWSSSRKIYVMASRMLPVIHVDNHKELDFKLSCCEFAGKKDRTKHVKNKRFGT